MNYSNYRLIILWYRQRLNSILIVGTCKGVDNVYIRRVGQDFHKNATYSEGSGNFVSESLLIESKSDLGLKNIHEIIAQINFKKVTREIKKKFKDQSKKLSILGNLVHEWNSFLIIMANRLSENFQCPRI